MTPGEDIQPNSVQVAQREVERLYACSRLLLLLTARERQIARYYGLSVADILISSSPERAVTLGFTPETPKEVGLLFHRAVIPGPLLVGWAERAKAALATMEAKYGQRVNGREGSEVKYARQILARKVREP